MRGGQVYSSASGAPGRGMKVLERRPRIAAKHLAWENSRMRRQIEEQWERWDAKRKGREGRRASQPVNTGLWQEPVHIRPRLAATRAQQPAMSFAALQTTTTTLEEEPDLKRCVNVRLLCRGKALRLKAISLGFWVCQEAQGSGG